LYDEFNNLLEAIDIQGKISSTSEIKLFESNERYKALVDNIPGVVFRLEYTDKWTIELVGEGVRELSDGFPVSYFVGNDIAVMSHILAPEFQQIFYNRTSESIGVNREFESIYRIITKIGQQKWILMRGRFVHHPDTKFTTIDGILFDQTDKIEAQNLLKTTEKRYHDLFDNLNDAAFLIELDTDVIVETNIEGEKILGLRSVDIVDKIQMKLLCKIIESLNIEAKDKTNEQSTMLDYYSEIVHSSGKVIPVHVRSSIVCIGEISHMLCLVRDISQQKEYENNLKKAKLKAEESDNLKSMFLSNMSHEIRTPLNGFIGFSKLILSSKSEEETKSYLTIIEGCGKQLLRIIDDILDVSRIETGQMTFYNEDFSINALLDEIKNIIEEQKNRTNKKNISIILNKGFYDQNDIIFADRHRLYQVIVNIASNAVKFTTEGEITISYKPHNDDFLLFKITDTGIGINPDNFRMIFNRFTQANSSIAPKYGGSGLGLAIAKGIIDLMGGDIWIESLEGIGSEFYFTIKNTKINKASLFSN
jgi:PAS domain S-box-containing protein